MEDGVCERHFTGHQGGINEIVWSSDCSLICSASDDHTIKLWDASTGACLKTMRGHTSYVMCCDFHPKSTLAVSGSFDETIRLWNVRRGKKNRVLKSHCEPVTSTKFNRDGSLIVSSSYDGYCRLWDSDSGECLKTIIIGRWSRHGPFFLILPASILVIFFYRYGKKGPCPDLLPML